MDVSLFDGTPTERQNAFLTAHNRYVCYGGARGGGKSWAIRAKIKALSVCWPGIKMLIIRRSYPELEKNHISILRAELAGIAKYNEQKKLFSFVNGSTLQCGYCASDGDALQYQGQEYDVVFIDEATQIMEDWFTYIDSTVRGTNDFPKRTYLTCNPGGVGHSWVKKRFVDGGYINAHGVPEDSVFIKSLVYDNKPLMDKDPGYLDFLKSIPDDNLRDAWINGNWDLFVGQFFSEYDRFIHVVEPIPIPDWWHRYVALDYGLDMLAVVWVAVDDTGREYVYREIKEPNVLAKAAGELVMERTGNEHIEVFYAPPDLSKRSSDTGVSIIDRFSEGGLHTTEASNDRLAGWQSVKEHIKRIPDPIDPDRQTSRLRIFSTCTNLIHDLPLLQFSDRNPCDADTEPHDITHINDALRYYCASRPIAPKDPDKEKTWLQKERDAAIRRSSRNAGRFGNIQNR